MFWQSPLVLFGVLAAVGNTAPNPVIPLKDIGEDFSLSTTPLDEGSLEKRFTISYVFRADSRSPSQLAKSDGFTPKGWTNGFEDVSLYRHVRGAASGFSMDNDGYVSTSSSQSVAEGWITRFLKGNGYTYKIATYANLIDVQDTLKSYNIYPEEREFAALKVIPWDQVMGWARFETDGKRVFKDPPQGNPRFNAAKYTGKAHAGAQYGLAGFPASHKAWGEDPWFFYSHCRPKNAKRAIDIFARESSTEPDLGELVEDHLAAMEELSLDTPEDSVEDDFEDDEDDSEPEGSLVARARGSAVSRRKLKAKPKPKTTKPKTTKPKTTKPTTKCTAAMEKAGKCKTTTTPECTAAMEKAGKCKKDTCSAADAKAGKCCSAADKKAGKCCTLEDKKNGSCKSGKCGPIKTEKAAAQEYWKLLQAGRAPKSGAKPAKTGGSKKGGV